ncbi:MAG: glycosyltransferase [Candidatus Aquicultorales bacterium]
MVLRQADKHVVFIGLNYQPRRRTSDKNFWVELIPLLAARLNKITIISVRDHDRPEESEIIGDCAVRTKYLSSRLLGAWDGGIGKRRVSWRGKFPAWLGVIEKSLSTKALVRELESLRAEEGYDHIHLMDNFGPVNSYIAERAGVPVSVSAIAYQGRRPLYLYEMYLKASYLSGRLTVVPFSRPYREKLIGLGVAPDRARSIPWGVSFPSGGDVMADPGRERRGSEKPLILWAGYGQQIGRGDFLLAYRTAKRALSEGLSATFHFAFKPESFERGFGSYDDPENGVIVTRTTSAEFRKLKESADVFFSPVANTRCVVAPPLTWLEVLASGMPIVTTDVPGTAEVIVPGKTGFRARSAKELVEGLFSAAEHYGSMKGSCVEALKDRYELRSIAKDYFDLFGIANGGF